MIIANLEFLRWAVVVFWYQPTPWWKLWRGGPAIIGGTIYAGPLKIVTGPRAP